MFRVISANDNGGGGGAWRRRCCPRGRPVECASPTGGREGISRDPEGALVTARGSSRDETSEQQMCCCGRGPVSGRSSWRPLHDPKLSGLH